jgi:hypothetical protein
MQDLRKYWIINRELIRLGDTISTRDGFFNFSQSKTKGGIYRLQLVDINLIDVSIKGISNRDFFYWEDPKYIDGISLNFFKLPPIILECMDGLYYSVDGHHRITAASELGLTNILSFVINVDKLSYPRKN